MGQTNDCKYAALQDHVFFGKHISDMWRDYLNTLGLSSKQINDMEYEFLADAGFADGELNDRWFAWLRFKGFTGALPDMWNRYWCDVANNVPGNPGLPAAWLLNASFDSYLGVLDQSLADAQVLGPAEGVQVGNLLTSIDVANGMSIANNMFTFDTAAAATDYLRSNSVNVWAEGTFVKTSHKLPGAAFTTAGFISATSGNTEKGVVRLNGGTVEYRDGASWIDSGLTHISGEDWSVLVVMQGIDQNYCYYKSDSVPWILVGITTTVNTTDNHGGVIEWNTITSVDQLDIGTDASAILDARGPDLLIHGDDKWSAPDMTGITVLNGKVTADGTQTATVFLTNEGVCPVGVDLLCDWTVDVLSAGLCNIRFGTNNSQYRAASGSYLNIGTSNGPELAVRMQSDFVGTIDLTSMVISEQAAAAPAALIDALTGDIVSASFGPAQTAGNVLTMVNNDELHDDYPTNGVGKIRKDILVYKDGSAETGQLSGGTARCVPGTVTDIRHFIGFTPRDAQAGLSFITDLVISGLAGSNLSWSTVLDYVSVFTWPYRIQTLSASYRCIVSDNVSVQPESIELVGSDFPVTGETVKFELTLGGFNVQGEPDPLGVYGCAFSMKGILRYTTALYSYSGLRPIGQIYSSTGTLIDSMQTKIDLPKLVTPYRALFATDESRISDYIPESGPALALVGKPLQTLGGFLKGKVNNSEPAYGLYDNPGGGYWEFSSDTFSDSDSCGMVLRYADEENHWRARVRSNAGTLFVHLDEVVAGVINARISTASAASSGGDVRIIVTDDGANIDIVIPVSGEVFTYSSTAGASLTAVGCLIIIISGDGSRLGWHCARMGSVKPYIGVESQTENYALVLNEPGSHQYALYFAGNDRAYSGVGGVGIPGMSLDPVTGILSGTPTVEAVYPRHVGATNAGGSVESGLHNVTVTAEVLPPVTAGLIAHYDASDISTLFQLENGTDPVVSDGDVVGYMGDKVGTANLLQATTPSKPTYRATGTYLEFDGADDYLVSGALSQAMPYMTFTVFSDKGAVNNAKFLTVGTGGESLYNASGLASVWAGQAGPQIAIPDQLPHVWDIDWAVSSNMGLDGATQIPGTANNFNAIFWAVGASESGANDSLMNFNEYVIYDHILTAQERIDTIDYLKTKWGIA